MGSQPIRIQLGKSCRKFLWENLVGNCCRKILREILAGNSCETRRRGKSQIKKGSDWWKFSIWNRVMGSQPVRIQLGKILQEILVGNSLWEIPCKKILREMFVENLVGKSCRKILWEMFEGNSFGKILREILQEIPHTYPQAIFEGNFQNMQFI